MTTTKTTIAMKTVNVDVDKYSVDSVATTTIAKMTAKMTREGQLGRVLLFLGGDDPKIGNVS